MGAVAAPVLAAAAAIAAVGVARSVVAAPRRGGPPPSADALVLAVPAGRAMAERVARAGLPMGPGAFVAAVAGATALIAVVAWLALRRPEAPVAAAIGVILAARALLAGADRRYLQRVARQLPAVAQLMAGAVAAGLSLSQAIHRAARDTPEPLGPEIGRVSAELDMGTRADDALARLSQRLPDPDLAVLVTAILVQRRTGGDLARALRDMAMRLEERGRLAREIRGATAQARATAWMVAGLPLLGAALAESASPGMLARTLGQGPGLAILTASVALQVVGIMLIRRIAAVRP